MTNQSFTSQLRPIFAFPFRDKQSGERFLVGCGLLLLGFIVPFVPSLIVFGYALHVLRSTAKGDAPSMPPWSDWPHLLGIGFKGALVYLLFFLPGFAVLFLGFAAYFGSFIPLIASSGGNSQPDSAAFLTLFIAMGVMFGSMAIGFLLFLLGLIPFPAALGHFVVTDQLGAAFRVREWWPILTSNWPGYLISLVILFGIFGIMNFAFLIIYYTFVLICLAYLILMPVSFYTLLVGAALFGDSYREGLSLSKGRKSEIKLPSA